jgi:hypothetical protein
MLVSGPIAVAALLAAPFASTWLASHGLEFAKGPWLLLLAATPLVPFLLALASWLSGRSRAELEADWNGLAGWQRGVLGTLIVLAAAAVILGGVAFVLTRLARP